MESDFSKIMVAFIVIGLPFLAVLGGVMFKRWMAYLEKRMELEASMTAEKAAQYAAHTERLEQRMRVLERIATDQGSAVAGEIENLRDKPLN